MYTMVSGIIKLITWAMVHLLGMWWPPQSSLGATLHAGLFLTLAAGTLYYFLQSLLEGPGFLSTGWKPVRLTYLCINLNKNHDFLL